ncbi:MAG: hypothetical protein IKL34_01060, partial [Alistipes sp.]|nr:hypothetical protein [Alistipes sp.]
MVADDVTHRLSESESWLRNKTLVMRAELVVIFSNLCQSTGRKSNHRLSVCFHCETKVVLIQ